MARTTMRKARNIRTKPNSSRNRRTSNLRPRTPRAISRSSLLSRSRDIPGSLLIREATTPNPAVVGLESIMLRPLVAREDISQQTDAALVNRHPHAHMSMSFTWSTERASMATKERLAAMAASLCAVCSEAMVAKLVTPDPTDGALELRTYACVGCGHSRTYSVDSGRT